MSGTLFQHQRANRRRSRVLVAVFVLFFAWLGFGLDLILFLGSRGAEPGTYPHTIPLVGLGTTLLALGLVWFSWRRGPREVLWATGAWELVHPETPAHKQLVNVVDEMAIASGLPRPTVWVIPDKDPNAFATGIDQRRAHVAVTEGLLDTLSRDELQAVIAHEMGHVKNEDVKLMTLLAALVGVLALFSEGMWHFMRGGGKVGGRRSSGGGRGKGNPLVLVLLVLWVVSVILAPLVSRLLALGVSRKREYLADAMAAQFTRNPKAVADALAKIEHVGAPTKAIKHGAAHLCIADPLGRRVTNKQGFMADLLGTHPPMAVRIARLRQMAYDYEKTGVLPEIG
ncbi:MAG: M48 family metalloprotease [Gemmatimonadales bacterium]